MIAIGVGFVWPNKIGGSWVARTVDNLGGRCGRVLAIAAVTAMGGCSSPPSTPSPRSAQVQPPPEPSRGSEARPDPGAERLVALLDEALVRGPGGYTSVRVGPLRNQSHASSAELAALSARLAGLLNDAGRSRGIEFFNDPDKAVDFELRGTAYLITSRGFDQWELYMSLRPAGAGWSAWRSPGPIRMLRLPVANAPQIQVGE